MSVEKRFRRCVDLCQCFLTPDLCVMCLCEEHVHSVLEGMSARIMSFSLWESSALICPFSRENWGNHLTPAARVKPLLRQRGD